VFAGYSSGWQSFVSPSGGFLIGFVFTAWLAGWGYQQLSRRHAAWLLPMFVGCQLVLLVQGAIGLLVAHISPEQIGSIMLSLLPGLLAKALLAVLLTLGLRAILRDDKIVEAS
jgi:biotin transport system substrate-specific component